MKMRYAGFLTSTCCIAVLGVLVFFAVSTALAQTTTKGSIEGTLTDSTGAAVTGMTVTATRQGGGSASATTNDEGFYRMLNLEPGQYTVRVEAGKGFAPLEATNVAVNLSRTTNVNVQLRPVSESESVSVTASSGAGVDSPTPTTTGAAGAAETVSVPQITTGGTANVKTNDGLTTVTFETKPGTVRVTLPDDMRAGDTISGTVVAEPKGQTEEERAKNLAELNGHTIVIGPRPPPGPKQTGDGGIKLPVKEPTFTISLPPPLTAGDRSIRFGIIQGETEIKRNRIDDYQRGGITVDFLGSDAEIEDNDLAGPAPVKDFRVPPLGQQGRPIEIPGPFDGNASNTTLRFGPPGSTIQEFVKASDSVEGGFGVIKPLAESPRKLVFEVPPNLIGPIELNVKDGSSQATGTHRNVGVRLSAPKTNLLKGEKTTLTTEVSGLQGITKPVPLTLTSEGVITMDGGPFQQFMIKPSEVNASGKYTTTRQVTGIMGGAWGATATVVTGRFNIWLQDDSDPNRLFHFNSFTGNYIFACGGGSCRSGAGETSSQPPTGSSDPPPPVTLTGIGKPQMKGCIITLSHNAPDRRVFARLDACTKTGDASVETKSPKANVNITDKNTTDNTTTAPPPK